MRLIESFIGSSMNVAATIYIWHKLQNKKINYKNLRLYISFILLAFILLFNYFFTNAYLRITMITLILMIFFRFLFKEKIQKCIITPIFTQLLIMASEVLFAIIISVVFSLNSNDIVNNQFDRLIGNLSISLISCSLVQIVFLKRFYIFLLQITNKLSGKLILSFSILLLIVANLLSGILYYKVDYVYLLVFNAILTIIYFAVIVYSFKTNNNYIVANNKYNTTLESLKEYEDILDKYRILSHENKNQLLTIRNMLPKTNKKIISYIDTLVENNTKDNNTVMQETHVIPSGGLRGLIYGKILEMNSIGINYNLIVSNEVKTVDLIEIDDNMMLDICKIIGVYIDNAIDEVKKLKSKNIDISLYIEEDFLIISVSNNYKGVISIERLEDKGYTTKGKGHGYGLSLAKTLINNNKKLTNEKQINKQRFTQILKIKI